MPEDYERYRCEGCSMIIEAEPPIVAEHPADECPAGERFPFVKIVP